MKLRLLILLVAGAVIPAQAEDYPLLLNQRFQLHYNQWQAAASPVVSTTQAVYEVDAGLPIFTYRLGALGLNGAMEYNRLATGSQADASTGLSRYGARISLFPYRPFRIYLDYQHSQTPDLFESGKVKGNTWGAGVTYASRHLQDVRLSYRHGDSTFGGLRDDWSQWRLESIQRYPRVQVNFLATQQEYSPATGTPWRLSMAVLDTESHFDEWLLRTRSQAQDMGATKWFDFSTTFYGPLSGHWHTLTTLSAGATSTETSRTNTSFASESLVYSAGRWNAHLSGSASESSTSAAGQEARGDSAALGATYTLTGDWRLHADAGVTALRQTGPAVDERRTVVSTNLGVARGGDVPDLIRHALFFLSDWSFNRRVREDYPPDYVPSELAQEMIRRRMRQSGNFGFTADVWRVADQQGEGRLDWARVTGQIQTSSGLNLFLSGDYKRDMGLAESGLDQRTSNLLMNGLYRLGATSLTASLGLSGTHQQLLPAWTGGAAPLILVPDAQSRYYSVGLNSRLGKIPVGFLALRFEGSQTPSTTTLQTWADLSFRQISLRVRFETSRMDNGYRSNRVTLDLLRWFDTITTRPWK